MPFNKNPQDLACFCRITTFDIGKNNIPEEANLKKYFQEVSFKEMNKKLTLLTSLLLCLSILIAGCGGSDKKAQTPNKPMETKKLSLGMLPLTSSAPLFIGIEKGFFKEQGIELDVQWFDAAQPIAVATASNKVDVGATGITAGLFNMVGQGQKLTIVADKGREQKGYSSSAIVVRKALYEQGLTSIEQLKGKKIGITQKGSTFHYMMGRVLESKNMSLEDVEIVPLGKLGSVMASLESGQIDAAILNEPNITKAEKAGYGKVLVQIGDVIEYQTSGIFFSPEMNKNEEVATRFMKAYIKSVNYYYDAVLVKKDGKLVPGKNYDEVIQIIAKYTKMPIEDIKLGLPYIDRDGKLLASDITTQINWYSKNKMLEKPLESKEVVNTSYTEKALKK